MRVPPQASHQRPVTAARSGRIAAIDNRKIARVAKLAGAPDMKSAGVEMHCRIGDRVEAEQLLYTVHAEAPGEMDYALGYVSATNGIITIGDQ
jgi:thymidine phosphorylase